MNTLPATTPTRTICRNLGATPVRNGVTYTVWAPEKNEVKVAIRRSDSDIPRVLSLQKADNGYFTGLDEGGQAGDVYHFSIDDRNELPDIASRHQPLGLFGPSMVINPKSYAWQAQHWRRPVWSGQVVYEMHVGTWTPAGTFRAAIERLDHLVDLGVTTIELMPLAEFTGERNWGYDGVLLFAPYHAYGTPDDLRAFIDACHARGLAVMLDVVYNHIGAVGDFTHDYSKFYAYPEDTGAWGRGYNLDGENSGPVRHFLLQNICYWLEDFHIDGFRLDATHAIRDESEKHLIIEATQSIHAWGGFVTAEDERNTELLLRPINQGGWGMNAAWADDFHHTMRVSQTREDHAYLGFYEGSLEEIADTIRHGWLYRGQEHPKMDRPRGTECIQFSPERFIYCISNHDQVGNRPFGERLHQTIPEGAYRALSLFFCLVPYTPLLFMGQEWGASSPFLFFTDHPQDFGRLVAEGRAREFSFDAKEHHRPLPDCQAKSTFEQSKLKWDELEKCPHRELLLLYREALKMRRALFSGKNPSRDCWKVTVGSDHLRLAYRWPTYALEVTLWTSRQKQEGLAAGATLLLRSSDERFGGNSQDQGPETVVVGRGFLPNGKSA